MSLGPKRPLGPGDISGRVSFARQPSSSCRSKGTPVSFPTFIAAPSQLHGKRHPLDLSPLWVLGCPHGQSLLWLSLLQSRIAAGSIWSSTSNSPPQGPCPHHITPL